MRPVQFTYGPLAAASANNIATSQTTTTNSYLLLNGTTGTAVANNIALSQTVTGATTVVLNGTATATSVFTNNKVGYLPTNQNIYITSAGNDSGITFTIVGLAVNANGNIGAVSEVLTGANTAAAVSVNQYRQIFSITTSGSTASTITVGSFGAATLDNARRVLITTAATISFTITGTDWAGSPISETVTNSGASVQSVLSYLTVTSVRASATSGGSTITVGTSTVGDSPWVRFDEWANSQVSIQVSTSGTVNYTLTQSLDGTGDPTFIDPNLTNTRAGMVWVNSSDANMVNATGTVQSYYAYAPRWAKLTINSGTGTIFASFEQSGVASY